MSVYVYYTDDYLVHHGIKGQRWGIRRYQNKDGSLTPEGYKHWGFGMSRKERRKAKKDFKKEYEKEGARAGRKVGTAVGVLGSVPGVVATAAVFGTPALGVAAGAAYLASSVVSGHVAGKAIGSMQGNTAWKKGRKEIEKYHKDGLMKYEMSQLNKKG